MNLHIHGVYASFFVEIYMSENEKRRSSLLEQLRNDSVPVVHPRYRATYNSIYQNEEKRKSD